MVDAISLEKAMEQVLHPNPFSSSKADYTPYPPHGGLRGFCRLWSRFEPRFLDTCLIPEIQRIVRRSCIICTYTLRPFYTLRSSPYALATPYTLHPTPFLHPRLCTLHPFYALHYAPYTRHPIPLLNPNQYTLHGNGRRNLAGKGYGAGSAP